MAQGKAAITPLKRFWLLLKPDKKEITNIYVYAIFAGLINLSLPLGIQAIINFIQGGAISTSWIILIIIVLIGIALAGALQINQLKITENLQQKIFTRASIEFVYRIPRVKLEALYNYHAPELVNRFFDTITVQKGLSKMLIDFSSAILQIIFGLLLLSFYHSFFLFFSLVLVVSVVLIFRLTLNRGVATSIEESNFKYKVAYWIQELARTSTTFKLAGKTDLALDKANDYTGGYLNAREKHFKILLSQYWLMVIFKVAVVAGLLIIGGFLVMEQEMNIGQFVASEIIILLIISSVEKLIMSMETIYDVLTGIDKISKVTDLELENYDEKGLVVNFQDKPMRVDIEELCFSYPNRIDPLFKNLNLTIASGERILLQGRNGSGKHSLLNIISGLFNFDTGNLRFNGSALNEIKRESLRSVTGDCMDQEQLFEGTILDNITLGRPGITLEHINEVVDALGLRSYINTTEFGLNTSILPGGNQISESTVKKILIARSVVHKPKLLLLKDAMHDINSADRTAIIDYLIDKKQPWTLIAVSTDEYFTQKVDRVVEIVNGKILNNA